MFQNLKVTEVTDKVTSTQKPYKAVAVTDEQGTSHKVNVFSDFPNFANIVVGSVIRGSLVQKGQYTNLLSETQSGGTTGRSGVFKTQQIEKAQENKAQYIAKAQDNKDWSIRQASSMSNAIALAIAELKDPTVLDKLEEGIRKWRTWILENWDVDEKDFSPF